MPSGSPNLEESHSVLTYGKRWRRNLRILTPLDERGSGAGRETMLKNSQGLCSTAFQSLIFCQFAGTTFHLTL